MKWSGSFRKLFSTNMISKIKYNLSVKFYLCRGRGHNWEFIRLDTDILPLPEPGYIHLLGREEVRWNKTTFFKTFFIKDLALMVSEGSVLGTKYK